MALPQRDAATQLQAVMGYAAELELEVDRLRSRDQFLQQHARDHIRQLRKSCQQMQLPENDQLKQIRELCGAFSEVIRDSRDPAGFNPAFDQVNFIALRPLVEAIFRWQQRLHNVKNAELRLDLPQEHVEWFPVRLRHIIENLISNGLRYRDSSKGEVRVNLALQLTREGYEFQFSDNGLGMPASQVEGMLEVFYRAAPAREAGLGVGLPVVRFLVEQCCGTITIASGVGQGTNVTVFLPRFDSEDYVE